jgi:23S rRNA (cytosine1962-C5)-methyltransferase
VGRGYGHPNTLITARILTRRENQTLDADWLEARLRRALELRAVTCAERSAFRWVHAEGDGLPGLVIDRFGDQERGTGVSIQLNTAGIERLGPLLEEVLRERFGIQRGIWRCTGRGRQLEGLADHVAIGWGEAEPPWTIQDEGAQVTFDPLGGQKTGLFLDMWLNRRRFAPSIGHGRVADLFSYVGQWGLAAAMAGATEVVCVDRSRDALAFAQRNFASAEFEERLEIARSDVGSWLESQPDRSFDAVICDPPAFIQGRKHVAKGLRAYRALFALALRKVRPGGHAVLASCSGLLYADAFGDVVAEAARKAGRMVTVLMRGEQAPCHPVPVQVPESRYLKCWLVNVG